MRTLLLSPILFILTTGIKAVNPASPNPDTIFLFLSKSF
jgi:hypothetical protein